MGLNYKLTQRFSKATTSDVRHTSSFAAAQNSGGFGAGGGQSFTERQEIELQRKLVQGYKNARVAQGINRIPRARTYTEELAIRKKAAENRHSAKDTGSIGIASAGGSSAGTNYRMQSASETIRQQMATSFGKPPKI